MKTNNSHKNQAILMEWIGDERGDNLAIKSGLRIYTVDKYGTLISQRYKRNIAVQLTDGVTMTPIDGLTDLRVGYTYSISQSEVVLGKLVESNLFGYRFLCINHKGVVAFADIDFKFRKFNLQVSSPRI